MKAAERGIWKSSEMRGGSPKRVLLRLLAGRPVAPPPCVRCGSRRECYTSGVCARCDPSARPGVDSCLDCYAGGATRTSKWLCHGCLSWRRRPAGQPPVTK